MLIFTALLILTFMINQGLFLFLFTLGTLEKAFVMDEDMDFNPFDQAFEVVIRLET